MHNQSQVAMAPEGVTTEELAQLAMSRSQLYGFLEGTYSLAPSEQLVANLRDPVFVHFLSSVADAEELSLDIQQGIRVIMQFIHESHQKPTSELRAELTDQYNRIVLASHPETGYKPPYESAYLAPELELQSHTRAVVARIYSEAQLVLPLHLNQQSDFIGVELDLMRHLCFKESQAWKENNWNQALVCLERESRFLDDHLTRWVPSSCDAMVREVSGELYRGIAQWTKGYVLDEAEKTREYLEHAMGLAFSSPDLDSLIQALCDANVAPTIAGLDFTQENVDELLALSHCRRCGDCCRSHSFIMVGSDHDLKRLARHSPYSFKDLKEKTVTHKDPEGQEMRYLSQPCMFIGEDGCQVYSARPWTCRVFPLAGRRLPSGKVRMSVDLRCEYGKDIYQGLKRLQDDGF